MKLRIPQRTRIYLGCEGDSERSYGKLLNAIAYAAGIHLAIDCDLLQPGGGNPLALVELAVQHIAQKMRTRGAFAHCAVLLDKDTLRQNPDWAARIESLAVHYSLLIIWQDTCHEGFLLRHLPEQTMRRPQNAALALQAILRAWPEYRKGMTAAELAERIDLNAVLRATEVEPDFRAFCELIGLIRDRC